MQIFEIHNSTSGIYYSGLGLGSFIDSGGG